MKNKQQRIERIIEKCLASDGLFKDQKIGYCGIRKIMQYNKSICKYEGINGECSYKK